MRRVASFVVLALAAACTGTTGPQPVDLQPLENAKPVRVLWSVPLGDFDRFAAFPPPEIPEDIDRYVFFPALAGGAVYAATREGTVARLDPATGRQYWRRSAGIKLSSGVGTDGRTLAVANEDGEVVAFDAVSGEVRWRARASSEVLAPPTVGGGLVLVRSVDNRIFAFGADDGKRRWVYQRAPASLILHVPAGVTLVGDSAYAGFPGGKLVALALSNGGQRWEATVSVPKGATELERVADVIGHPTPLGRDICAVAYQGRIACYEAASGRQIWARDLSSFNGASADGRYLFVSDDRGAVQALDRSNGQSLWKQDKLTYHQLSLPLAGEHVVVGDASGFVHFLSRDNGAFVARFDTRGARVRATPLALPAGLLVQTDDGTLYALAP